MLRKASVGDAARGRDVYLFSVERGGLIRGMGYRIEGVDIGAFMRGAMGSLRRRLLGECDDGEVIRRLG
jgi:hypothetical protein